MSNAVQDSLTLSISIGRLRVMLDTRNALCQIVTQPTLNPFLGSETDSVPNYSLHLVVQFVPDLHAWPPGATSWQYTQENSLVHLLYRPLDQPHGWTHRLELDLAQGTGKLEIVSAEVLAPTLIDYKTLLPDFLDRFIFTEILNWLGTGCLIHSASVIDGEQAVLLVGQSEAGKSTISRLWQQYGGPAVQSLTDEYSLVREVAPGEFWVFGTPWPSSAGIADKAGAPLGQLYFLRHAPTNQTQALDVSETLLRLLAQGQFSFWHTDGIATSLEFLIRLAQHQPGYELGFVPDAAVIEYIRKQRYQLS